ncbi:MAG: hypothetical protein DWQ37_00145 [Planctomycetota bacterium]|nr:MAG: hypothetical protein DWQ37_00145 [Planctomycetota bacterium]
MARIACQYARLSELVSDEAQAAARWLSADERRAWESMRSAERKRTWLGGRTLAKRMLLQLLGETTWQRVAAAEIHIETRSTRPGHGERPVVFVGGERLDCGLSIAHTSRGVLVAVSRDVDLALGVDLVCRADASPGGLAWSLSTRERHWLATGPRNQRSGEQIWAMKEALYKAAQRGEGFSPAQIETVPGCPPTYPGTNAADVQSLESWRVDGHYAALAVVRHREQPPAPVAADGLLAATA